MWDGPKASWILSTKVHFSINSDLWMLLLLQQKVITDLYNNDKCAIRETLTQANSAVWVDYTTHSNIFQGSINTYKSRQ